MFVTIQVKKGIASGYFDDGPRMEQLDVAFAIRYLQAFEDYRNNRPVTESWDKAFKFSSYYWSNVL